MRLVFSRYLSSKENQVSTEIHMEIQHTHAQKARVPPNYSAVWGSARASVGCRAYSRGAAGGPSGEVVPSCESSNGTVAVVGGRMGPCDGGYCEGLAATPMLVAATGAGIFSGGGG